jgi:iron complex transport system permease protein
VPAKLDKPQPALVRPINAGAADALALRLLLVLVICVLIVLFSSFIGGTGVWWLQVAPDWSLWTELRLPRVVNGVCVGALLALSGLLLQVILRNPLADPYLFGSASGAALAQVLALGLLGAGFALTQLAGFAGALTTSLIVLTLASGSRFVPIATNRMIIFGVAVASLLGAALQMSLLWLSDRAVRGIYFWLLGSIGENWQSLFFYLLTALVIGIVFKFRFAMDALRHGEVMARNWGVDGAKITRWLLVLSSLATALAVGCAGALGFVGLAAPHLARLLIGPSMRGLLPASLALGAALVVLADALARWLLSPVVLPVGILTTVLGVPWLIQLLRQQSRHD